MKAIFAGFSGVFDIPSPGFHRDINDLITTTNNTATFVLGFKRILTPDADTVLWTSCHKLPTTSAVVPKHWKGNDGKHKARNLD